MLTAVNYVGLKTLQLETKKVTSLTNVPEAGWNVVVSDNSKMVCFEKIDYSTDPFDVKSFHTIDFMERDGRYSRLYTANVSNSVSTINVTGVANHSSATVTEYEVNVIRAETVDGTTACQVINIDRTSLLRNITACWV